MKFNFSVTKFSRNAVNQPINFCSNISYETDFMTTKTLMIASSFFMGFLGLTLTFFPEKVVTYMHIQDKMIVMLCLLIISSQYLGFGILNWMAKSTLIGGIYARPLTLANLMHFGTGALALFKISSKIQTHHEIIFGLMLIYSFFSISFVYIFLTSPHKVKKPI